MKKVIGGLAILLIVGLVVAACSSPVDFTRVGSRAAGAGADTGIVWNGTVDKDLAVVVDAVKNDARKNASGPKITSNAHSADFPGLYFIWDSKQADSGYLKVSASVFELYDSFILTAKESNAYWDFEISVQSDQEMTTDGCFVFFIPKVMESGKNINMIFVSEFSVRPLVLQELDYTEFVGDVPNPDRGLYRANDGLIVPISGSTGGSVTVDSQTTFAGSVQVGTRVSHMYFDLRNYSSNAFTGRGTQFSRTYAAPAGVSIGTRPGDQPPYDYPTHFAYWQANVLPAWPKGNSQPLSDTALEYIRNKLQQVRAGQGVALARFNYDGAGYSWVEVTHNQDGYTDRSIADIEPDKEMVLMHISQIKPILHEFEDVLMAIDGGFFGPWGEMHSTSFGQSTEAYAWLLEALLDAVPESRSIIVHAGAFLSWYNWKYGTRYTFDNLDTIPAPQPGTPESRFGFFNDSYAYGEDEGDNYPNDWGSLSEGAGWPGDPLGPEEAYDRGKVMTWIRKQNNLYGGEAQGDSTLWNTFPFVAWEASYAQTVYLNRDYETAVHNRWRTFTYNEANVTRRMTNSYEEPYKYEYAIFDPVYDGRNGAEFMRDRLGYRLVLREVNASEWVVQNGVLRVEGKIQNVGFGNIVNRKKVTAILRPKDGGSSYSAETNLDVREWRPDLDNRPSNTDAYRDFGFVINMSAFGGVPSGDYDILLKINDPKEQSANKRCIQFANNGAGIWDAALGANLIGSVLVK